MPSVIDLIKETEERAMDIRQTAQETARSMVSDAADQAARREEEAHEDARKQVSTAVERSAVKVKEQTDLMLELNKKQANAACEAARGNLRAAVDCIIEGVVNA